MNETRISRESREKAKDLRKRMTKAEVYLWNELRELRKTDGLKFRRQAPLGPYIVDFVNFEHQLVVEIDGDWHETGESKRHDANRDLFLKSRGFSVIRLDEPQVKSDPWYFANLIREQIANSPTRPAAKAAVHPPRKGEGNLPHLEEPQ